jgi:DNA-binding transcriptional LysR family regulator
VRSGGFQTAVELRDLRWAIVASQHRSLRQAAEVLNIRQSTLSRRLRALEYQLGAVLFERTNGGTRPTVAGQEFLDAALRIIGDTDTVVSRLKTRSRGESGRLTIGVHASLSAGNCVRPSLSIVADFQKWRRIWSMGRATI